MYSCGLSPLSSEVLQVTHNQALYFCNGKVQSDQMVGKDQSHSGGKKRGIPIAYAFYCQKLDEYSTKIEEIKINLVEIQVRLRFKFKSTE